MRASRLLRCDAGYKQHSSSSFCFRSTNVNPMKNYNFGWGRNFLKTTSSFISMFYDPHRSVHVVRIQRCLTKTVSSISFSLIRVKAVSIWSPSKIIIFEYFPWGPNLIESPSSLVHKFQTFYRHHFLCFCCFPICNNHLPVLRMHKTPHQNLGSIAFFLPQINTVSIWADLSPIENNNFRWGPNFTLL